jgi:uncharacterized protein GlcG (DUF336 family)
MDLVDARLIVTAVERAAEQLDLHLSTCVVDDHGHEVLTARMTGAAWFTPHVCRTKARTCVAMGMDSRDVAGLAEAYPALVPVIDEQLPFTLTTLQGGVLVEVDGEVLGAVACSGALPAQDDQCARAGVDAWTSSRG